MTHIKRICKGKIKDLFGSQIESNPSEAEGEYSVLNAIS